jgi:hypothetical protein
MTVFCNALIRFQFDPDSMIRIFAAVLIGVSAPSPMRISTPAAQDHVVVLTSRTDPLEC